MKKKSINDSTMWFHDKKVGTGTISDGESFTLLLEECKGNPHEVLRRYPYLSDNTRKALEKAIDIFDKSDTLKRSQ